MQIALSGTLTGRDGDFVAHCFAPPSGIDDDPVTGSARRQGRATRRARKMSARGGTLGVTDSGERVLRRGRAVTTLRGTRVVQRGCQNRAPSADFALPQAAVRGIIRP